MDTNIVTFPQDLRKYITEQETERLIQKIPLSSLRNPSNFLNYLYAFRKFSTNFDNTEERIDISLLDFIDNLNERNICNEKHITNSDDFFACAQEHGYFEQLINIANLYEIEDRAKNPINKKFYKKIYELDKHNPYGMLASRSFLNFLEVIRQMTQEQRETLKLIESISKNTDLVENKYFLRNSYKVSIHQFEDNFQKTLKESSFRTQQDIFRLMTFNKEKYQVEIKSGKLSRYIKKNQIVAILLTLFCLGSIFILPVIVYYM